MNEAEQALLQPRRLYTRAEILSPNCPIPDTSGAYAFWFLDTLGVPDEDCVQHEGKTLLYVGISPRVPTAPGQASKFSIRSRIRYHFQGTAENSTLRLTLGCLLRHQLRRVGAGGKRRTFAGKEKAISDWMDRNAFVSWIQTDRPWEMEKELLEQVSLPFNLDDNDKHHFHWVLTDLRRHAKRVSLELPIVLAPGQAPAPSAADSAKEEAPSADLEPATPRE